ncbi:MAG: flagellar hook-basal body protein [Actinobacteria bacterium]|nr:flagellar hook-basal body protein [Actinomycetota bacterium]
MIRGIYTAASGLGILQARMDATSNNLANVSTTGYKQERVQVAAFPDFLLQEKVRVKLGGMSLGNWSPVGYTNQGAVVTGVVTDHTGGILKETGKETDLALSGEGFFSFEVRDKGGTKVLYSREGALSIDGEGYLVDTRGNRILGENGPVKVGGDSFTVDASGVVTTSVNEQIKLTVVEFADKSKLVKEGNNYYSTPAGNGTEAANPGVTQRYLETSNVDVSAESVNLIEIMRAYEAGQRLIQRQDDLTDLAINKVGTVR